MNKRRLVVLFGDSLLMDTVEASLGDEGQALGVVRMYTTVPDAAERLKSLHPDLVIFELDTPHAQLVLSFLKDRPGTPFLGLDLTCSKVITLSSYQYTALTMDDLLQVIQIETVHTYKEEVEPSDVALDRQIEEFRYL